MRTHHSWASVIFNAACLFREAPDVNTPGMSGEPIVGEMDPVKSVTIALRVATDKSTLKREDYTFEIPDEAIEDIRRILDVAARLTSDFDLARNCVQLRLELDEAETAPVRDLSAPVISLAAAMAPFAKTRSLKDITAASAVLLRTVTDQISPKAYSRIESICESVKTGLALRESSPLDASIPDPDIFRLQQSVLSYVPTVVDAYLAVPYRYVGRSVPGKKTADEHLAEQIGLIDEACEAIVDRMVATRNARLEDNKALLLERFGS
jgi:hypothetical protein